MTVHEVVKSLRYLCAVLKEYNATEQRKRAEAKRRADEAARRKAEEAAAREAEMKAAQERLLARAAATSTGRRRPRRGDGPRASTPIEARPSIPSAHAGAFTSTADWTAAETSSPHGLSPGLVAMMTQLGRLHAALRELFTATKTSRAWYQKISTDKQWGPTLHGLMAGLMIVAVRIARRMFHRDRFFAWQRKMIDFDKRLERMIEGDWREKVRYLLWANGQQQARQAAVAA